jgi:CRP-like cAMP-binding protein
VLTLDQRSFERILRERPETGLAVIRELCARLKESELRATHVERIATAAPMAAILAPQ